MQFGSGIIRVTRINSTGKQAGDLFTPCLLVYQYPGYSNADQSPGAGYRAVAHRIAATI